MRGRLRGKIIDKKQALVKTRAYLNIWRKR